MGKQSKHIKAAIKEKEKLRSLWDKSFNIKPDEEMAKMLIGELVVPPNKYN